MAPNPRRIAAKLDEAYAQLPRIECQGLCSDACGPIPAGGAEQRRMEKVTGRELGVERHVQMIDGKLMGCHECSMLEDGRCVAYDVRPMICRLWGVTEDMKCPYGCVPEGGHLSVEEGLAFLAEAMAIAGWPAGAERFAKDEIKQLVADPQARRWYMESRRPTVNGRLGSMPLTVLDREYRG
jgi:Fe-S-cluster containining protein